MQSSTLRRRRVVLDAFAPRQGLTLAPASIPCLTPARGDAHPAAAALSGAAPSSGPTTDACPVPEATAVILPQLSHPVRVAKDACSAEPAFEFLPHALTHWPLLASQPYPAAR